MLSHLADVPCMGAFVHVFYISGMERGLQCPFNGQGKGIDRSSQDLRGITSPELDSRCRLLKLDIVGLKSAILNILKCLCRSIVTGPIGCDFQSPTYGDDYP